MRRRSIVLFTLLILPSLATALLLSSSGGNRVELWWPADGY